MADEGGGSCLICLKGLLEDEGGGVGALRCGHVYHRNCVALWLAQSKDSTCPSCKKTCGQHDVRTLHFEVSNVPLQSFEEIRLLEGSSLEQCERRREELLAERAEALVQAERLEEELIPLHRDTQEHKRLRLHIESEAREISDDLPALVDKTNELNTSCSMLQASLDADAPRFQKKLPVHRPREEDQDLREERRKINFGCRPGDRARQLHEALVSAMGQEKDSHRTLDQRRASAKQAEEQLREWRREEVELRRQLDDHKLMARENSQEHKSVSSSQASSQAPISPATSFSRTASMPASSASLTAESFQDASFNEAACSDKACDKVQKLVVDAEEDDRLMYGGVKSRIPAGASQLAKDAEEDDPLLYGGVKARLPGGASRKGLIGRGASSSALGASRSAAGSDSKFGALFSAGSRTPAAETAVLAAPRPALQRPTSQQGGSLRDLFARRIT